jgi:type IV pilus assembly protein PilX
MNHSTHPTHHTRGIALVTALMFLLALTILGIASIKNATLQEHMAGNFRDRNLAKEAAEIALRHAEMEVNGKYFLGNGGTTLSTCAGAPCRPRANLGELGDFSALVAGDCNNGICYGAKAEFWTDTSYENKATTMGTFTCTPVSSCDLATSGINGYKLAKQPIYWIEPILFNNGTTVIYRVTARGYGQQSGTYFDVQAVFNP